MVWKLELYCHNLLNIFVVKTQTFQTFTLLYLTPRVYLHLWFWIKMPTPKREEAGYLSKYERQKELYMQSGAGYGSVRNLVNASNIPVSNVRQFSNSKPSYTKLTLASCKFKKLEAFGRFKKEIWCMDIAYVEKLANDNNGVNYLLNGQDLFDRTVDAKGMKTIDSEERVGVFLTRITKRNWPTINREEEGTELAGKFKKLFIAEEKQIYSTRSETKAAFVERPIRSWKNILHRNMETYGCNYVQNLSQFITALNFRKICSTDLIPKKCQAFRHFVNSVQQTTWII